jgi:hypothetical protein
MSILAARRRAELQADLNAKREIFDTLVDRLQDYKKVRRIERDLRGVRANDGLVVDGRRRRAERRRGI